MKDWNSANFNLKKSDVSGCLCKVKIWSRGFKMKNKYSKNNKKYFMKYQKSIGNSSKLTKLNDEKSQSNSNFRKVEIQFIDRCFIFDF